MVFIKPESDKDRKDRLQTDANNGHEDRFAESSLRVSQAEQEQQERLRPIIVAGIIARRRFADRLNTRRGGKSRRNKRNRKSRK